MPPGLGRSRARASRVRPYAFFRHLCDPKEGCRETFPRFRFDHVRQLLTQSLRKIRLKFDICAHTRKENRKRKRKVNVITLFCGGKGRYLLGVLIQCLLAHHCSLSDPSNLLLLTRPCRSTGALLILWLNKRFLTHSPFIVSQ